MKKTPSLEFHVGDHAGAQMAACSTVADTVAAGPKFLDFYGLYAARMPGRMASREVSI